MEVTVIHSSFRVFIFLALTFLLNSKTNKNLKRLYVVSLFLFNYFVFLIVFFKPAETIAALEWLFEKCWALVDASFYGLRCKWADSRDQQSTTITLAIPYRVAHLQNCLPRFYSVIWRRPLFSNQPHTQSAVVRFLKLVNKAVQAEGRLRKKRGSQNTKLQLDSILTLIRRAVVLVRILVMGKSRFAKDGRNNWVNIKLERCSVAACWQRRNALTLAN